MEKQSGRQFDRGVAAAFLESKDQVVRIMAELMPDSAQLTSATAGAATMIGIDTPAPAPFDSAISTEHPIL